MVDYSEFQSTRPQGARLQVYVLRAADIVFQSTRPQGARRCVSDWEYLDIRSFNPRARRGRDTLILTH